LNETEPIYRRADYPGLTGTRIQSKSAERQKILDCLSKAPEPIGPKEIANTTGLSYDSVRHLIRHMEAEGSVNRKARGKYTAHIYSQEHNQEETQPP
jgi:DNA-binding GntR family transcriptional regulator